MSEGKITITSETIGDVQVRIEDVETFSTDTPIELHFKDGTVLTEKVQADDAGLVATEGSGVVKPQTFAVSDIVAVNPPSKPKPKWKGDITAGYTITKGNSNTSTANVNIDMARRSETDRITLGGAYLFSQQEDPNTGDNETTTDKWYTSVKYDYFFAPKAYTFVDARLERNRIADLDMRLTTGLGAGFQWIETERIELNTEAGLAWLYEAYSTDETGEKNSSNEISAQLGYHLDASLNDHVSFLHRLKYYPAASNLSDYYLTTDAELRADLTRSLFASIKGILDFDSTPAEDAKHSDITYIFGLGIRLF